MHYYQFHIGDFRGATMHLSNEEELAYRRLLDWYYDTEKPIPLETQSVSRRLRVATETVNSVLKDFFIETPEGWVNYRCESEICRYQDKAEKNRENGKKGGRPKGKTETKKNPTGFQSQPSRNPLERELNLNQEPITSNQEPEDQKTCAQQDAHELSFVKFWKLYPRKTSKEPARKAWLKLKPNEELLNSIMKALATQSCSTDWLKDNGQFIPHASTWLNQKRWEDEVKSVPVSRHHGFDQLDYFEGLKQREDGTYGI